MSRIIAIIVVLNFCFTTLLGQNTAIKSSKNLEISLTKLKDSILANKAYAISKIKDGNVKNTFKKNQISVIGKMHNGLKTSYWAYFSDQKNVLLSEHYINGKLQGEQIFYVNEKAYLRVPYINNKIHGMVVWLDSNGQGTLNRFFIHGIEMEDRSAFNKLFYSKTTQNGNAQIIKIDAVSETEPVDSFEVRDLKIENLKAFMDKAEPAKDFLDVNKYEKSFSADYFLCYTSKLPEILFTIHSTDDGIYVLETKEKYKAKENEILFLMEHKGNDISGQQFGFVLGDQIKASLKNRSLDYEQIIRFINKRVFYKEPIESWRLSKAIQRAMGK